MAEPRKLRIIIKWRSTLRKLCKICFTSKDASIYIIPYAQNNHYFYSSNLMGKNVKEQKIKYKEGFSSTIGPHLSIHESGIVAVYADNKYQRAGPLKIPALHNFKGEHIASVSADRIKYLPTYAKTLRKSGEEIDHVIPADQEIESARIALYLNGYENKFVGGNIRLTFTIIRAGQIRPLYFAIRPIAQNFDLKDNIGGVTIIAGWDPTLQRGAEQNYICLRGE